MSENHYISQCMVAAVTPVHPGESSSATLFDVVQSVACSEHPVCKKACVMVHPPWQSLQAKPSQQQLQAMRTSPDAKLGPLSQLVKADLNKRVVEYFFTQPMRSYEDDMKFIEDLVTQFAQGSGPSNAVMWRLMHEKGIKETSQKTWQEIVRHFKEAPQVNAVLQNWRYVDHEVQMDDGTMVIHPFHCPVLSTIMIEAIWVIRPTYHSHISRQENDVQLEKILAFFLWGGPEPDFGSSRYSPVYKLALDHLTSLRQGTPGDRALMNLLLLDIWACSKELLLAYVIQ
ncbi:hypothetical protein L210DRAFT_933747 [Boletus edulis BED1]|uniref:Uncharacterized protein n=1 Tax=Boletus edulis BED1 TaxID=1328754 RepID=A0AAD4GLY8_BOLED|nr:hypothetical protein L210DRAFT_933747 [Boletus edulis BED1]